MTKGKMTKEKAITKIKELNAENVQIKSMMQQYQNGLNQNVGAIKILVESFQIVNEDLVPKETS